ncbi:unnamed protein product [Phaeothamnion confervicola]
MREPRRYYRRQPSDHVPFFLREELAGGDWTRFGLDVDFPVLDTPEIGALMGRRGQPYTRDTIDIRCWWHAGRREVIGSVFFATNCEGPPGGAHGGAVATALDDALGATVFHAAGFSRGWSPTIRLHVRYRRFVPLAREVRLAARVTAVNGGKVFCHATLTDPGPDLAAAPGVAAPVGVADVSVDAAATTATIAAGGGAGSGGEDAAVACASAMVLAEAEGTFQVRGDAALDVISYDDAVRLFGRLAADPLPAAIAFFRQSLSCGGSSNIRNDRGIAAGSGNGGTATTRRSRL